MVMCLLIVVFVCSIEGVVVILNCFYICIDCRVKIPGIIVVLVLKMN